MFCNNCGSQIPDNSAVCPFCGAPAGNANNAQQPMNGATYQQQNYQPNYQTPFPVQQNEGIISTGKWFGYQLIPFIPFVGGLIFLIMLFVWAFGNDKPETFRNWAKSQLLLMLVVLALSIIVTVILTILGINIFRNLNNSFY